MQAIDRLSPHEAQGLQGLLFDLDDTLLSHGKLSEAAYQALFRLNESGLNLLAVTGRPLSWGKLIARQWPVAGAVCENGAAAALFNDGRLEILVCDEPAHETGVRPLATGRSRLRRLAAAMQAQFRLVPATDAEEREHDFTFDIGEYQSVPPEVVTAATAFANSQGVRTTRSSVHLHITESGHDKASGTLHCLAARFGCDQTTALSRFAYIGDSENDAACFAAFRTTIGVKNLRGRPTVPPRFITHAPQGAGFAEAAKFICDLRHSY